MKEIFSYLQEFNIESNYVFDFIGGARFEFKIFDCDINIVYNPNMTIQDFKNEANKQYLEYLKRQAEFYKSMSDGLLKQIDNFKPILN
jgi:hypothetical protein